MQQTNTKQLQQAFSLQQVPVLLVCETMCLGQRPLCDEVYQAADLPG